MKARITLLCLLGFTTALCAEEAPLSAVDWLSESVKIRQNPLNTEQSTEPTEGVLTEVISVSPLEQTQKDAVGLVPAGQAGFPSDFWGDSSALRLKALIRHIHPNGLPETTNLFQNILLTEFQAPLGSGPNAVLLLARLDRLLEAGALEQAEALLEHAGPDEAELFRRYFDVSLLIQRAEESCRRMLQHPAFAPTLPARIFCLARGGDWNAAALTLATGQALGKIDADEADLLARFLDPELFEGEPDLPPPDRLTPLAFVMREAIHQPRPHGTLPLAFLHLDLQNQAGWKTRLLATERLVASQAFPANMLSDVYLEGKASASGGVWERVRSVQQLGSVISGEDPDQIGKALEHAYDQMQSADLLLPLAQLYAEPLSRFDLSGTAKEKQFHLALLHQNFETLEKRFSADTPKDEFLHKLASGAYAELHPENDLQAAIKAGLLPDNDSTHLGEMIRAGQTGEAVLRAIDLLKAGKSSDPGDISTALSTLVLAGLENSAQRIALQLLIL